MYNREALAMLNNWADRDGRKPLVVRGARQVGKTTLIHQFAKQFDQYLYFNLDKSSDRAPFEDVEDHEQRVQALFFSKNEQRDPSLKTLIFIDEIQEMPSVLHGLRYFYEENPELYVVAAGSLLETLFDNEKSFPVGRVEYFVLRPTSFSEFLGAMGEKQAKEAYSKVPCPEFAHKKLLKLFHTYALIGGMPEIVSHYAEHRDLTGLQPIYEGLITSYLDDVEKYAAGDAQVRYLRHCIGSIFYEAGTRITFAGFGKSNYKSREMKEALEILEKAMLMHMIYPTVDTNIPLKPSHRKSPRLQVLDTGLMNYKLDIQRSMIGVDDLETIYKGTLIEHLVGQELLANDHSSPGKLKFWVREKNTSQAELDFLRTVEGTVVPVEAKSGKTGKLKSLHLFMDRSESPLAIRHYADIRSTDKIKSKNGRPYTLLNLPYYLAGKTDDYAKWWLDGQS